MPAGPFRLPGGHVIVARLLAFTLRVGAAWVLWLLIGLSVVSVMVMLDRWLYFGRRRMSRRFPELLRLCQQGELPQAARLAGGDAMEAEVVRVALSASVGRPGARGKALASTHHC